MQGQPSASLPEAGAGKVIHALPAKSAAASRPAGRPAGLPTRNSWCGARQLPSSVALWKSSIALVMLNGTP